MIYTKAWIAESKHSTCIDQSKKWQHTCRMLTDTIPLLVIMTNHRRRWVEPSFSQIPFLCCCPRPLCKNSYLAYSADWKVQTETEQHAICFLLSRVYTEDYWSFTVDEICIKCVLLIKVHNSPSNLTPQSLKSMSIHQSGISGYSPVGSVPDYVIQWDIQPTHSLMGAASTYCPSLQPAPPAEIGFLRLKCFLCARVCACLLAQWQFHDQNSANKGRSKLNYIESWKAIKVSFPELRKQGKLSAIKDESKLLANSSLQQLWRYRSDGEYKDTPGEPVLHDKHMVAFLTGFRSIQTITDILSLRPPN